MEEQKKTMYELELNESLTITIHDKNDTQITRVPDGWIYTTKYLCYSITSTFVQFSSEFIP